MKCGAWSTNTGSSAGAQGCKAARQQAPGRVGPQAHKDCQEKNLKKVIDLDSRIWDIVTI